MDTVQLASDARVLSTLLALTSILVLTIVITYAPPWLRQAASKLHTLSSNSKSIPAVVSSSPQVSKDSDFPSDWWTSPSGYALEKRAIFSKTWLHVSHRSLFKKPGDYRTFTIGDFSFLLIVGKDGELRAFHNVCRHRAYNVCNKEQGSSLILRCRYHGWTYDSKGKLVNAPKFDAVEGFDKSQNGLFEIRSWTDSSGFIYVNFDVYGSDGLTIRVGVPIRASLDLVESWTTKADFNWKIAMPKGSFKVRALATPNKFLSYALSSFESWKWPAEFELSPLTRLLRSTKGDLFLTVSVVPAGNESCNIVCHLYNSSTELPAKSVVSTIKQEISDSVTLLQADFDEVRETGVVSDLQSQEPLLAELKAHSRLERLIGTEVYPASRMRETSKACKVADDLCRELEAATKSNSTCGGGDNLAW